jgi:hypothetical protein
MFASGFGERCREFRFVEQHEELALLDPLALVETDLLHRSVDLAFHVDHLVGHDRAN